MEPSLERVSRAGTLSPIAAERALGRAGVGTAQGLRPNRWWSGACVLGGKITIATLILDADGVGCFDGERSAVFELAGRDQHSVRELHSAVGAFAERMSLLDIHLRIGPSAGPKMGKAKSHVCECVLHLLSATRISTISANSLNRWILHKGYEVGNQARDRYWQYAFAAAAFAAEHDGVEVKLPTQE